MTIERQQAQVALEDFFAVLDADAFFEDLDAEPEPLFYSEFDFRGLHMKISAQSEALMRKGIRIYMDDPAFRNIRAFKVVKGKPKELDLTQELNRHSPHPCSYCKQSLRTEGHEFSEKTGRWRCPKRKAFVFRASPL